MDYEFRHTIIFNKNQLTEIGKGYNYTPCNEMRWNAMKTNESFPRRIINERWWLFSACSMLIFIVSYIAAVKYTQSFWPPTRKVFFLALYTCTGPFASSVANWLPMSESLNWIFGIPGSFLLFLHPLKPRTLTAIITLVGFMVWLFMGLVMIYVGV